MMEYICGYYWRGAVGLISTYYVGMRHRRIRDELANRGQEEYHIGVLVQANHGSGKGTGSHRSDCDKDMTTLKPVGKVAKAIDHQQLIEVLQTYNRYEPQGKGEQEVY